MCKNVYGSCSADYFLLSFPVILFIFGKKKNIQRVHFVVLSFNCVFDDTHGWNAVAVLVVENRYASKNAKFAVHMFCKILV